MADAAHSTRELHASTDLASIVSHRDSPPRFPAPAGSLAAAAQAPANPGRRALIGGAGIAALMVVGVAAAPAMSSVTPTAFDKAEAEYRAAIRRFNGLPNNYELTHPEAYEREMTAMIAVTRRIETMPIANWQEFARAFAIATDNGENEPGEIATAHLFAASQRLAKQEG